MSFRTQYDYPFIRLSGKHPGLPIQMWCIWNPKLLSVPTRDEDVLKGIEKEIRKAGRIVDRWTEAQETRLSLLKCTCGDLDSPWNAWEAQDFKEARCAEALRRNMRRSCLGKGLRLICSRTRATGRFGRTERRKYRHVSMGCHACHYNSP